MRPGAAALLFASCAASPAHQTVDLGDLFATHDAQGALVVTDRLSRETWRHDPERCAERVSPASTFKLFHFMAALECGAVAHGRDKIDWDGTDHGNRGWNRDHDAVSALRTSAVWFYRETARRIGPERMQELLRREEYGNQLLGEPLDAFWLEGDLAISPDEQVEFLLALHDRRLGFPLPVQHELIQSMPRRRGRGDDMRVKTGWVRREGKELGWLVGFAGSASKGCAFALLVEPAGPDFDMREARERIAREALERLGYLTPPGAVPEAPDR